MESKQLSKGLFTRRRARAEPLKQNKLDEVLANNSEPENIGLAFIKLSSNDCPIKTIHRPIAQACRSCITFSQATIQPHHFILGCYGCFGCTNRGKNDKIKYFSTFLRYLKIPEIDFTKRAVTEDEIKEASLKITGSEKYEPFGTKSDEVVTLSEFSSIFSPHIAKSNFVTNLFWKIGSWIFHKILALYFKEVVVSKGQIDLVTDAIQTGIPIIYVSLNRSLLDGPLITWTLYSNNLPPPAYFISHSLINTRFGKIMKYFGGFGICNRKSTKFEAFSANSSASFPSYIWNWWRKGNSIILPLEPHRSQSGKPSGYLAGSEIFGLLLKLYHDREIEDAYIIPVSVNYDLLPEEDSLLKISPIISSFSFYKLFKRLKNKLGFARIGFGQPYRLREYKFHEMPLSREVHSSNSSIYPSQDSYTFNSGLDMYYLDNISSTNSVSSFYGEVDFIRSPETKALRLMAHALYDSSKSTVIMSTQLLSFLMLYKFRKRGVLLCEISQEFDLIMVELRQELKIDLGFSGNNEDVILYAANLLGQSKILVQKVEEGIKLNVVETNESILKLNYYASHVMNLYALKGAVAIAIFNLVNPTIHAYKNLSYRKCIKFSIQENILVNKALEICELLKCDFFLHRPCISTKKAIEETIENLIADELLRRPPEIRMYGRNLELDEDEYDSDGSIITPSANSASLKIFINMQREALEKLNFLKNLFLPYLNVYSALFSVFKSQFFPNGHGRVKEIEETVLHSSILKGVQDRLHLKKELITSETVRNFMELLLTMKITLFYLEKIEGEWRKLIYLHQHFEKRNLICIEASIIDFTMNIRLINKIQRGC